MYCDNTILILIFYNMRMRILKFLFVYTMDAQTAARRSNSGGPPTAKIILLEFNIFRMYEYIRKILNSIPE